jgi:hypothetical protein
MTWSTVENDADGSAVLHARVASEYALRSGRCDLDPYSFLIPSDHRHSRAQNGGVYAVAQLRLPRIEKEKSLNLRPHRQWDSRGKLNTIAVLQMTSRQVVH